jgi:hypothetical protein
MTKAQKVILPVAAALIIAAFLFPPYWDAKIGKDGELYAKYTKWEFNRNLRDLFRKTEKGEITAGGIKFGLVPMIQYLRRDELLLLEIFGVLVLAWVALLITKKK